MVALRIVGDAILNYVNLTCADFELLVNYDLDYERDEPRDTGYSPIDEIF